MLESKFQHELIGELEEIRQFLRSVAGTEGEIGALSNLDLAIDTLGRFDLQE